VTHSPPGGAGLVPPRIAALVRDGVLDEELASLVWLLVESRLPVVVAGGSPACRTTVRAALLDLLPPGTRTIRLRGQDETFDWLPEAAALGWRGSVAPPPGTGVAPADPAWSVLLADLEDRPPDGTWGERARLAIRAVTIGYGMAATAGGDRLEDVLARLAAAPVAAIDDELTRLGIVLVLAPAGDEPGRCRVAAAHYLRPVQRDVHGHVQRMTPAVLATWDARTGQFEHFAWGIADELAGRTGRSVAELERDRAHRAAHLSGLWRGGSAT
jgi:hypothetical protein